MHALAATVTGSLCRSSSRAHACRRDCRIRKAAGLVVRNSPPIVVPLVVDQPCGGSISGLGIEKDDERDRIVRPATGVLRWRAIKCVVGPGRRSVMRKFARCRPSSGSSWRVPSAISSSPSRRSGRGDVPGSCRDAGCDAAGRDEGAPDVHRALHRPRHRAGRTSRWWYRRILRLDTAKLMPC